MATFSRRVAPEDIRLVGRPWNDVTRELQDLLSVLLAASDNGLPPGAGDTDPTTIEPDDTADPGDQTSGWAPIDHVHAIATAAASGLANANAEGTSTSFSRADHTHKRDVRVKLEGSDIGTRNCLNFLDSSTVNITATDDSGNDEVEITAAVIGVPVATPSWTKYTVTHTALQTAGTSNDIELFSLVAGGIVHAIKIKHSVAFGGGAIASYTISVGIAGNLTKYASPFDVFSAPSNTNFQLSSTVGSENHGAATSIRIAAVSTGANLNASTAGSVDVWALTSVAV